MKTNKLFAVAAMLPVLFSCAKEEIRTNDNLSGDGQKYDFTITVSGDEDSITKASLSDEIGIFWVGGGKAGIVKKDGENTVKYESNPLEKTYIFNGNNQASFAFSQTYEGEYKFFYPYHNEATLDKIPFWVDPNQKTSAGSSADCFALVSDGMVSLTAVNHDIGAETKYKVVGSYIRFLPFGKEGEIVKFIVIEGAGNTVSGRYFVNGNDNTLVSGVDYNAETITLTVENDYAVAAAKEKAQGLYTPVLPGNSKNTYTVLTDKGFYLFESGSEKEFKFGSIKDIPLNLEKAARTPKSLYVVGDATTAGWTAEKAIPLTKDGNKYIIENIPLIPGGEGFKFLTKQGRWSHTFVNAGDNKLAYYVNIPDGKDIKFKVDKPGYYDLVVDFDTNEITCTLKGAPQIYTYPDKNQTPTYMSFTEPENIYKGIVYIPSGDGCHDFKVFFDGKYYHPGNWQEVSFGSAQSNHNLGYDWDVVADGNANGWYLSDDNKDANRYYEITLDLTNPAEGKVSAKLAQGSNFWLVGAHYKGADGNWAKHDDYKRTVENGVVTWNVTINVKEGEKSGFYIAGEYDTEAYFSDTQWGEFWEWNVDTYGGEQKNVTYRKNDGFKSWAFTEAGDYTVEFRPAELKINVTKNTKEN